MESVSNALILPSFVASQIAFNTDSHIAFDIISHIVANINPNIVIGIASAIASIIFSPIILAILSYILTVTMHTISTRVPAAVDSLLYFQIRRSWHITPGHRACSHSTGGGFLSIIALSDCHHFFIERPVTCSYWRMECKF